MQLLNTIALIITACSSLPTDVQRDVSHALADTSTTSIAMDLQPLLEEHPELSGFKQLSTAWKRFTTGFLSIIVPESQL
jgi:putative cardiolipin synthase